MAAHSSTFLLRRAALLGDLGLVDEGIPGGGGGFHEDYDTLIRAARLGPIKVVDEPIAVVHWHGDSFYMNRWETSIEAIEYLIENTPEIAASREGCAKLRGQQAFALAGLGRNREALAMARRAFMLNPIQLRTYLACLVALTPFKAESIVSFANSFGRGI
jgi:hypothetical protein